MGKHTVITRPAPVAGAGRFHDGLATQLVRLLAVLLAGGLVLSASAGALVARGHVYGFSFGAAGGGDGEFVEATQVAVDEASGDVYVVDGGGERVEVFKPEGGSYQYLSQFKVDSPGAIAVDNSTDPSDPSRGGVYVVGAEEKGAEPSERDLVYEYSPNEAKVVAKLHAFRSGEVEEELEEISGVAVDDSGVLWVYWEEEGTIDGFRKELNKQETKSVLAWEPSLRRTPEVGSAFGCPARGDFAVGPGGESFNVGYERLSASEECPGADGEAADPSVVAELNGDASLPATLIREVDHQNTMGVAVDTGGEVYLDNVGDVAAFTQDGKLVERFGAGHLQGGSGVAVDSQNDDVYVADSRENKVDVFEPEQAARAPVIDSVSAVDLTPQSSELRARIDPGGAQTSYVFQYGTSDCASEPAACAEVGAGTLEAGFGDREVSVRLTGLVPATSYYYRVLTSNTAGRAEGVPSPNTFATLPSASVLPDGRAWEMVSPAEKHGASVEAIGLGSAGSIQAAAEGGALVWIASGPVVSEPQGNRSFEPTQLLSRRGESGWSTQSLETPHEQGRGLRLPSPSEYHYFSPDLALSLVQPIEPTYQVGGVVEHPPLSPEASEKTMYVRHDPPSVPEYSPLVNASDDTAKTQFGGALEFLDASSDLQHVVFDSKVGLTAGAPAAAGLYEWSIGKQASEALQLVSVLPDGMAAADEAEGRELYLGDGGGGNDRGATSSDGSSIVWSENRDFVPERLYLRDTVTGETIQVNAAQGQGSTELGAREQSLPEPLEGQQEVHFQAASSDGSRIFFTDTARLSEESSEQPTGEESPADLYEFEVTSRRGEPLRGHLTDVTADETEGSADVLNVIPGVSENGEDVFFVANGMLAPGARRGQCPRGPEAPSPAGATCNLYLSEPDPERPAEREIRFIAALSYQDAADWGAGVAGSGLASVLSPSQDLSAVTASVSSNGRYLAFMSDQSLAGYDNLDATSGQPDEEVYLYDVDSSRLVCASCNPNPEGEGFKRPHGVFDSEYAGEGLGLLADRPEIWRERWLAGSIPGWAFNIGGENSKAEAGVQLALYQPRYLSENGRLFFDSPDDLVPAASNGKEDVYEYEPEGIGSCTSSAGCIGLVSSGTSEQESAFLDASENGEDVFFTTAAQLVPGDTDHAYDIYDAHVCSQSSPCTSSNTTTTEQCESTRSCHGPAPTAAAQIALPATASVSTPESISAKQGVAPAKILVKPKPPTRAQKLAQALAACRKLRNRHKRHGCESQARKRYTANKHRATHKRSNKKSRLERGASRSSGRGRG